MATFENRTYDGETVELDGNTFIGCRFENCVLNYRGGPLPELSGNSIQRCRWNFNDSAELTLRFIAAIYHSGEGGRDLIERIFDQIRGGNLTGFDPPQPN